ncbi:MAG: hypothetical protein ACRDIB_12195, partial [Ardenticatenaceae bacterium]
REMGRLADLVGRLLDLDRIEEAEAAAREAGEHELLPLADLFISHGHGAIAERLVRERLRTTQNVHVMQLMEWLKRYVERRGDLAEALSFAESLFWQRPWLAGYNEVKRLAQATGQWDDRRPALLEELAGKGSYGLLTEIHLEEGEIAEALKTLPQARADRGWWGTDLTIKTAQAAEARFPRDAIRLYMERINGLIEARGRGNYAAAATYPPARTRAASTAGRARTVARTHPHRARGQPQAPCSAG